MKECTYKEASPMTHHGITYENEYCRKNDCVCCGEEECGEKEFESSGKE